MSIRQRLRRLEKAVGPEPCPACALRQTPIVEDFDDSPVPPDDPRTYEELCRLEFCSRVGPTKCPRCGGDMRISVIQVCLHSACRHPDYRKRMGIDTAREKTASSTGKHV